MFESVVLWLLVVHAYSAPGFAGEALHDSPMTQGLFQSEPECDTQRDALQSSYAPKKGKDVVLVYACQRLILTHEDFDGDGKIAVCSPLVPVDMGPTEKYARGESAAQLCHEQEVDNFRYLIRTCDEQHNRADQYWWDQYCRNEEAYIRDYCQQHEHEADIHEYCHEYEVASTEYGERRKK